MNKRLSVLAGGTLVIVCLVALSILLPSRTPPSYEGKTLNEWISQLQRAEKRNHDKWHDDLGKAQTAIRAMGTNALPFLIADVTARPTPKDRVAGWLVKHAPFLKLRPPNIPDRWVRGIRGLEVLGPVAKPHLPELTSLATNNIGYGPSALLAVGADALPAVTNLLACSAYPLTGNLIGALANAVYAERIKPEEAALMIPVLVKAFRSTDTRARYYAAAAMGAIHQHPELCVPVLAEGLGDPNPGIPEQSSQALGRFGDAAAGHAEKLADLFDQGSADVRQAICGALANFKSTPDVAVPILMRGLTDADLGVRVWAANGLGQLAAQADKVVPALVNATQDHRPIMRSVAVQAVGLFGDKAKTAVPDLERMCLDPDASVRNAATNALRRVEAGQTQ